MSELTIGPGRKIVMHFAIKLEDGQVVDSNFEGSPAEFEFGDGNVPEGFEQALVGLKTGDHVELTIAPERGFGQHNPSNMQTLKRADFKDMELEPGLVISFQEPGGEIPGVVAEFDEQNVVVDFNHPLAGKTLTFEVKVTQVS